MPNDVYDDYGRVLGSCRLVSDRRGFDVNSHDGLGMLTLGILGGMDKYLGDPSELTVNQVIVNREKISYLLDIVLFAKSLMKL